MHIYTVLHQLMPFVSHLKYSITSHVIVKHPFSFYSEVAKGLMKYQPDIIISVHPLMQHVPLRILRSKGLLDKIVFTTVITDLSTCHPTWLVHFSFYYYFLFKKIILRISLTSYFLFSLGFISL